VVCVQEVVKTRVVCDCNYRRLWPAKASRRTSTPVYRWDPCVGVSRCHRCI